MRPKPKPPVDEKSSNSQSHLANDSTNSSSRNMTNTESKSPYASLMANRPKSSKIPWSGIAAGNANSSVPSNSTTPMSFANAAAQSILRSTTPVGSGRSHNPPSILTRSSSNTSSNASNLVPNSVANQSSRSSRTLSGNSFGSVSTTGGTLHSNLKNESSDGDNVSISNDSINETNIEPNACNDQVSSTEIPPLTDSEVEKRTIDMLRSNSSGKTYSAEEMVEIWSSMKKNNLIRSINSPESRSELHFSATPNDPALIEQQKQPLPPSHAFFNQLQYQSPLMSAVSNSQQQLSQLDLHRTNSSLLLSLTGNDVGNEHFSSVNNSTVNSVANSPRLSSNQLSSNNLQNSVYFGSNLLTSSKASLEIGDSFSNNGSAISTRSELSVEGMVKSPSANSVSNSSLLPGSPAMLNTSIDSHTNQNSSGNTWNSFNSYPNNVPELSNSSSHGRSSQQSVGSSILGTDHSGSIPQPIRPSQLGGALNSGIISSNTPAPPGIAPPQPYLIPPEQTEWYYKDRKNNIQGPFNGLFMQQWFNEKWFSDDLLIKRSDESEFYMLREFIKKLNYSTEPFLVSLPDTTKQPSGVSVSNFYNSNSLNPAFQEVPTAGHSLTSQIGMHSRIAPLQQIQQQQNTSNNSWASMSPSQPPISPWAQNHTRLHHVSSSSSIPNSISAAQDTSSNIPVTSSLGFHSVHGSQVNLSSHISSTGGPTDIWNQSRNNNSIPQTPHRVPSISNLNGQSVNLSKVSSGLSLDDGDLVSVNAEPSTDKEEHFEKILDDSSPKEDKNEFPVDATASPTTEVQPIKPPTDNSLDIGNKLEHLKIADTTKSEVENFLNPEASLDASLRDKDSDLLEPYNNDLTQNQNASDAFDKKETLVASPTSNNAPSRTQTSGLPPPESAIEARHSPTVIKPVMAPWAKKESTKPKVLSLKEIQEMEAAEQRSRKAQQAATASLLASRVASTVISSSASNASLPSSATWASVGVSSSGSKKTLAQIQKEEEEAALQNRKSGSASASGSTFASAISATPANLTTVSQTKKFNELLSTASSAPANAGGAWTTVGPGGKKVGSQTASSVQASVGLNATPNTPVKKQVTILSRNAPAGNSPASSVGVKPQQASSALSSASEEFLNWCKASLVDLNSGVNKTELLSMLLSLPSSSESKEIIADSIYSNSTTMDGRRFADEFLKRRNQAESGNNSTQSETYWSDILSKGVASKASTNDGWNVPFKVVGKKKNRVN